MSKKIIGIFTLYVSTCFFAHSATIVVNAPPKTSPSRSPVIVTVTLDPEKDVLSGISGNLSFPSDLFTISNISTESSVVSLWVKQPAITYEKFLDGRTHILFEGIFPGGYEGVRSPYYNGTRPGNVFTLVLVPKNKGVGTLLVDDVQLLAFNSEATPLPVNSSVTTIENPELNKTYLTAQTPLREVESPTLNVFVTRDPLVNNNAWYLMVNEREQKSSIERIYVAENEEYHASLVDEYSWHLQKMPYILFHQNRSKYIHIKVVYSNNTYTLRTVIPVENSQTIPLASRILISVALALLVLYIYATYFFIPSSKQEKAGAPPR